MSTTVHPAYLIKGDDAVLVANELRDVVAAALGDRDPSLAIEEVGGSGAEDLDVGAVIDAFTTPAFLVDRRIVIVRDAGRLDAESAKRLAATLDPPPPGGVLILAGVGGKGGIPQSLVKAIKAVGEVIDISTRQAKQRQSYITEHVRSGPVRLNAAATQALSNHLGEDLGRLQGILDTLASAYGRGVTVDVEMLEPFLGARGTVPIWDLTDAIDAGDSARALGIVDRMMGPGGSSEHELLASLDNHFTKLVALEGADVRSAEDAAALLGMSEYPARKLLGLSRTLEPASVRQAVALLAQADLDIKGMTGLGGRMIVDILVARLCRAVKVGRR